MSAVKISNVPEEIYLVFEYAEEGNDFKDFAEVLWCKDSISSSDVKFVRADRSALAQENMQLRDRIQDLGAMVREVNTKRVVELQGKNATLESENVKKTRLLQKCATHLKRAQDVDACPNTGMSGPTKKDPQKMFVYDCDWFNGRLNNESTLYVKCGLQNHKETMMVEVYVMTKKEYADIRSRATNDALEIVANVAAQYPIAAFPENSSSVDASSARMARLVCKVISEDIRAKKVPT